MEERNLEHNYAQIDMANGECMGVMRASAPFSPEIAVYIPIEAYNEAYMGKFYNQVDAAWYEDAAFIKQFIL